MPEVSAIIITHNSFGTIKACLDSIKTQTFRDLEIRVIDNDSKDGTKDLLKSEPEIKLIESNTNQGFSKANNQGICLSKGKYILTINPDTVLDRDFILNILEFLKKEISFYIELIRKLV